jgi:beta-glucosidase
MCAFTNGDPRVEAHRHKTTSVTTYELNLCGFERTALQFGQPKSVSFKLPASDLRPLNRVGRRVVEPGKFNLMTGASSADLRLRGSFTIVP